MNTEQSSPSTLDDIRNYRAVSPRLATSGQPDEAQLAAIAAAGFDVVINLALHDDPRYSLTDEAGTVQGLGLEYVHIPVQFAAPTHDDLARFMAAMSTHAERRVWVHCAANYRVSAFVGLDRVLRQGWSRADAFALMDDIWKPDEVWSTFINTELVRT